MEIAPGVVNWVLGSGAFGGIAALVWVVLNFIRGSSKDATEAFTELAAHYKLRLEAERDECARRIGLLEDQLREKEAREDLLFARLEALERRVLAQGEAGAHFVRKLDGEQGETKR